VAVTRLPAGFHVLRAPFELAIQRRQVRGGLVAAVDVLLKGRQAPAGRPDALGSLKRFRPRPPNLLQPV
jgi:hypothetical protein